MAKAKLDYRPHPECNRSTLGIFKDIGEILDEQNKKPVKDFNQLIIIVPYERLVDMRAFMLTHDMTFKSPQIVLLGVAEGGEPS